MSGVMPSVINMLVVLSGLLVMAVISGVLSRQCMKWPLKYMQWDNYIIPLLYFL
jgi:hypothetical protein